MPQAACALRFPYDVRRQPYVLTPRYSLKPTDNDSDNGFPYKYY